MRILLTGHEGYIGSVMTEELLEAGHDVVGLDTLLFGGCDFGQWTSPIPTLRCDLRDVGVRELEGFEAVVHLAAISNDPLGNLKTQRVTENLFKAEYLRADEAKGASSDWHHLHQHAGVPGHAPLRSRNHRRQARPIPPPW